MEIAALAVNQQMAQSSLATNMVKQNAKAEAAIVELIQSAAGQGRGQNLDITV